MDQDRNGIDLQMDRAQCIIELLRSTPRGYLIEDMFTGTATLYDRDATQDRPRVTLMTARIDALEPAILRGVIVRTRREGAYARYELSERVIH